MSKMQHDYSRHFELSFFRYMPMEQKINRMQQWCSRFQNWAADIGLSMDDIHGKLAVAEGSESCNVGEEKEVLSI